MNIFAEFFGVIRICNIISAVLFVKSKDLLHNNYINLRDSLYPLARQTYTDFVKNEALNVFITGLNKDFNFVVKSQNPGSLEKATSVALTKKKQN